MYGIAAIGNYGTALAGVGKIMKMPASSMNARANFFMDGSPTNSIAGIICDRSANVYPVGLCFFQSNMCVAMDSILADHTLLSS